MECFARSVQSFLCLAVAEAHNARLFLRPAFLDHQALASPALKSRHWETLSEKTGSTIEPDEELTLQQLVDTNVGQHIETIHEVGPGREHGSTVTAKTNVACTDIIYPAHPFDAHIFWEGR